MFVKTSRFASAWMVGLVALSIVAVRSTHAAIYTATASGNWTDDANWDGAHPTGQDAVAEFTTGIDSDRVVTLDAPITVGALNYNYTFNNNSQEYTLSGANALTFDHSSGTATITRTAGRSDVISASVTLLSDLLISQPDTVGSGNLTISGAISGDGGITRTGGNAGPDGNVGLRVVLSSASNDYTGDTVVNGGRLRAGVTATIPFGLGKGNVVITGNGGNTSALELSPAGTYNINGLSGDAGGFVVHGAGNGSIQTLAVGHNDADGFDFGGTIRIETATTPGTRKLNFEKVGSGTQTLSGTNTYNGTTTVTGGTLSVTGNHVAADAMNADTLLGDYTVTSGATLGGTGTIEADVFLNGTISPGVTVGNLTVNALTLQSGASAFFTLDALDPNSADNDLLTIVGALTGTGDPFAIEVEAFGGGLLSGENTWTLASYGSLAGTLPLISVVGVDPGYDYAVTFTDLTGGPGEVLLSLTAANVVPEPGTMLLAVLGAAGLVQIARTRRK